MTSIPFLKMHGAGNDFVVIDNRKGNLPKLDWQKLANRNFGIGCDQVVIMEQSVNADVFMRVINADGGEVESCGNASRCVAWLIGKQKSLRIETLAGIIEAQVTGDHLVTVDMGEPHSEWEDIPLAEKKDTLHLPVEEESLKDPVAINMGNPHMIFFVRDLYEIALEKLGPILEHHSLFPERANVSVAQIQTKDAIALRVWERGAGLTLACGTAACATLVAANRRGLVGRKADIALPGGILTIEWRENNHVFMTGPVATSFEGQFDAQSYQS